MHALLLLAGRSRRFWPLSEKALWPFLGDPLLAHQLKRLRDGGIEKVTFVGGHHNLEEVHRLFPNIPAIEQEDLTLGMRGALLSALPNVKEPVCIVSSNDVIDVSGYRMLLDASHGGNVDGALLAQRTKQYFPGGYLVTSPGETKNGCPRVAGVMEKPGDGKEPSDLVNIVAHVHNDPEKLLDALEQVSSSRDDGYEVALASLCKTLTYIAVPYEGQWNAVKHPWDILDLTRRFLLELESRAVGENDQFPMTNSQYQNNVLRPTPYAICPNIHPSAVIEGHVILEEGVRVMPHATVVGPCYIGKGTIIGNNALVRESIIGEQCVIGFGSEVARSNLHSHVWTHSTYLGDCVIGHNVAFGAGSVSANFRLDEGEIASFAEKLNTRRTKLGVIIGDNVRIGVHVSFAPGVKVGSGSFVATATYVSQDVAENRYVHTKEGVLEERENASRTPKARK